MYRILTKDSSIVTFLCGSNADIMIGDDYKILNSTKIINCGMSLRGINLKSDLFWRKDGLVGYEEVKSEDTLRYNKIFDNKDFIKERSN